MPIVKFRLQYKCNEKHTEVWDEEFPRTYFDQMTPDAWADIWEEWFKKHLQDTPRGAKCFFYSLNTDTGEMFLDESRKILKLKPQPRILNDDSRQTPEQEKASSSEVAGEPPHTHTNNGLSAFFADISENDF